MGHHVKTEYVKTRKPHNCWGCQRNFDAGVKMCRTTSVDMGKIFSVYECEVCLEVLSYWDDYDRAGGYSEGDVKHGDPETWEETRAEMEPTNDN